MHLCAFLKDWFLFVYFSFALGEFIKIANVCLVVQQNERWEWVAGKVGTNFCQPEATTHTRTTKIVQYNSDYIRLEKNWWLMIGHLFSTLVYASRILFFPKLNLKSNLNSIA